MICKRCGAENPENTDICEGCGGVLNRENQGTFSFIDDLACSTFKTLRNVLKVPDWIVKCLFMVAVLCFAIGLAVAIWYVTAGSYPDASVSELAKAFLSSFSFGLFASGLVAGFALLLASLKRNAEKIVDALVAVLYVVAAACFLIGTAHAALVVQNLPDSVYPNPVQAMYFLVNFLQSGVLYGAVLFGFASLVSRREDSLGSRWPAGKILYISAAIVFLLSIVIASLLVNSIASEGDQSWVDLAIMFPYALMSNGMLYGGIIAGIGGIVSYSSTIHSEYYCEECGNDVLLKWKICPFCGSELYEVDGLQGGEDELQPVM